MLTINVLINMVGWGNHSITSNKDVILIKRTKHEDYRGTFVETFNRDEYKANGIEIEFVKDAISTSSTFCGESTMTTKPGN